MCGLSFASGRAQGGQERSVTVPWMCDFTKVARPFFLAFILTRNVLGRDFALVEMPEQATGDEANRDHRIGTRGLVSIA